ncbi:sugar phosphate isomerase/epimerase [Buttiauxella warmboldiae]|uniref:Sugar phosphate isomerase/epimerase n=1 Tax=Buttiauxella warmboldiae TaxID=82993 RepID=A0A3N5DN89_9ENTR|nr:TIM barrel protein [Buttiauxella warmboldiae]RPH30154.1 sugar phosphate isomerase/epimerase [Buttiauxella warmboldiae]
MKIGLSTWAYFWRLSDKAPVPLTLFDALNDAAEIGAEVFQICDYPQIAGWSDSELTRLRQQAEALNISLELGTKGVAIEHLRRYLKLAEKLDCRVLRSMINSPDHRPTLAEAQRCVESVLPQLEKQHLSLCFETYEQVPTHENVALVKALNSRYVGICLDPANCVAALELPDSVVGQTADYVLNWHVKDFAFSRRDGWVGFTLAGCPLGEGLLNYDAIWQRLQPRERQINQIIEHWLPWLGDSATTCETETIWTRQNMLYLQQKNLSLTSSFPKESHHVC